MVEYRFYKTEENRWYIDLPDYIEAGGYVEELEMVAGADIFLDILSAYANEVILIISNEFFDGSDKLIKSVTQDCISGAYYYIESYQLEHMFADGFSEPMEIWLCDVTKYVFGNFPETIYFKIK